MDFHKVVLGSVVVAVVLWIVRPWQRSLVAVLMGAAGRWWGWEKGNMLSLGGSEARTRHRRLIMQFQPI